jgi:SH3 domain-containing YSC84-like protein 1
MKGSNAMKPLQLFLFALFAFAATGLTATEEEDQIRQASAILRRFNSMPERQIPREILRDAKGLAILTVVKGGFIWSGKFGRGVVIARNNGVWAGPSFIRTAGVGFGAQIGGQVTEFVLVLNTPEAVRAFAAGANVELGGALSVAAGPVGRSAEAGITTKAAVYTYSLTQGLFAGVSLDGTVISTNHKANERYYHTRIGAESILSGKVVPPRSAAELFTNL